MLGFSVLAGLLVTVMVTPALAVTGLTASTSIKVFEDLPSFIEIGQQGERTRIFAKQGGQDVQIATIFDQNREQVGWDQVSQYAKDALTSGEDRRFYEHGGVDVQSVVRAAIGNVTSGGIESGASTLTMQLVKNIFIQQCYQDGDSEEQTMGDCIDRAQEQSIDRKLREMRLAIQMEKKYTKDEILLAYLNIAGFGGTTYGIEAAAQRYYNTTAANLTIAQAASLIGIVQEPGARNLAVPENYPANQERRDQILKRMLEDEKITQEEYDAAIATPVDGTTVVVNDPKSGCLYAHDYAKFWCDYIDNVLHKDASLTMLGEVGEERDHNLRLGGYDIYTSLNLDLQTVAQDTVQRRAPNTESRLPLGAASTSLEVGTGWIITMAENKIYDNTPAAETDPTRSSVNYNTDFAYGGSGGFQTGSTFKPLTLLAWLKAGHGLNEVVDGTRKLRQQSAFTNSCNGGYGGAPWDIKNDSGTGRMSVLNATINSVNNAFIEMALKLDMCDISKIGNSLGIHSANGDPIHDEVPSFMLGLGNDNVAPLTMAAAYATVANNGTYCAPRAIMRIVSPAGEELGEQPLQCRPSEIDAEVAAAGMYAMERAFDSYASDPDDGTPMFGKTGSTTKFHQTWLIGSSTKVTTATWVGNIRGQTPTNRFGYSQTRHQIARPILAAVNDVYGGDRFPEPPRRLMTGNSITVPDGLIGLSPEAAQRAIEAADLNFELAGEVDSDQPAGTVAATDPAPGTGVSAGTTIRVSISNGAQVKVPDVVSGNPSPRSARTALEVSGFSNITEACVVQQPHDRVVSVTPAPGTPVSRDTQLVLGVGKPSC